MTPDEMAAEYGEVVQPAVSCGAESIDCPALLLRALDLLSFGVVACDARGRLALANSLIDDMAGGLCPGQEAEEWATTYGLADGDGRVFAEAEDIPLVRALVGAPVDGERMRQRCGSGAVVLIAHAAQVRDEDDELLGAVGVFIPSTTAAMTGLPRGGASPAALERWYADPILIGAALHLAERVIRTKPGSDPLIERVVDFIREHQREQFTLSDVAAAIGYSPSHLTTLVRRYGGEPLMQMAARIRLESARGLLELTDLPIGAVARESGPWDSEYFARMFRQHYGCSPSTWREEVAARRIVR